jgi:hypothetical protein
VSGYILNDHLVGYGDPLPDIELPLGILTQLRCGVLGVVPGEQWPVRRQRFGMSTGSDDGKRLVFLCVDDQPTKPQLLVHMQELPAMSAPRGAEHHQVTLNVLMSTTALAPHTSSPARSGGAVPAHVTANSDPRLDRNYVTTHTHCDDGTTVTSGEQQ